MDSPVHPPGTRSHHHDAVSQEHRLVHVMRDDQMVAAVPAIMPAAAVQAGPGEASSAENGSSSSKIAGVANQRTRDRHALPLAAGQVLRPAHAVARGADALEHRHDAAARALHAATAEGDIAVDRVRAARFLNTALIAR
jgi:hypothetical protein